MTKKTTKKGVKASKHNMPTSPMSKLGTRYHDIKDLMGWRKYDPGIKVAEAIAQDLLEYASEPHTLCVTGFFVWYGIPRNSFYKLKDKYECIQYAHEMALMIFGGKREAKALSREFDPGTIQKTLHHYHPMWRKVFDEDRSFKKEMNASEDSKKPTHITVLMDDYGKKE